MSWSPVQMHAPRSPVSNALPRRFVPGTVQARPLDADPNVPYHRTRCLHSDDASPNRASKRGAKRRVHRVKKQHAWPEGHWDWPIKVSHKHGVRGGQMIWVGGQVDLTSKGEVRNVGNLAAQVRNCV